MGFDIHGVNSISEKGEYFHANVWWWRPLWRYVVVSCHSILTEEEASNGEQNNCYLIKKVKADAIADRLRELDQDGKIMEYELEYKKHLKSLPLEKCDICDGQGIRNDEIGKQARKLDSAYTCNSCNGQGEIENFNKHYPFESDFVIRFAEFCEDSGGFEIC